MRKDEFLSQRQVTHATARTCSADEQPQVLRLWPVLFPGEPTVGLDPLASPVPRSALVLGKALSAGVRGLSQAAIVYALAWLLGVDISWSPVALLAVTLVVILGSACFSTLSLNIASLVKTRERFIGIGQVLTMPLFFASNAIYPLTNIPGWLQLGARLNPLTYEVDALRALMLRGGTSTFGIGLDVGILIVTVACLVAIGGRIYPRIAT